MAILNEEVLEPFARLFRFFWGFKEIEKTKNLTAVDLGSGPQDRFYKFCQKRGLTFDRYISIDPLCTLRESGNFSIIKKALVKTIPLKNNSVDYIFGFAFIEHINHPEEIIRDSYRVLKKGGKAIFTTPTPFAKQFLEVLSFRLGFISRREIAEHKNYFNKAKLHKLASKIPGKHNIKHEYFEFGLNNLFVIEKL